MKRSECQMPVHDANGLTRNRDRGTVSAHADAAGSAHLRALKNGQIRRAFERGKIRAQGGRGTAGGRVFRYATQFSEHSGMGVTAIPCVGID